jgi:hypothetical protein
LTGAVPFPIPHLGVRELASALRAAATRRTPQVNARALAPLARFRHIIDQHGSVPGKMALFGTIWHFLRGSPSRIFSDGRDFRLRRPKQWARLVRGRADPCDPRVRARTVTRQSTDRRVTSLCDDALRRSQTQLCRLELRLARLQCTQA